jgi:hypothetical protein
MISRETNYYMSKGRALRRIVSLFDTIEDMICENDRRCNLEEEEDDDNGTLESVSLRVSCDRQPLDLLIC